MRWLLALQLALTPPTADITWTARQRGPDTVFVMTYPAPVTRLLTACMVFYEGQWGQSDYAEWQRHCWTPTNPIADFDTWPGVSFTTTPYQVLGYVTFITLGGTRVTHWAFPLAGDS